MSLYSRLDRLAADVERLDRQLTSVSNHPQSQRTSVEGGSIDFNDEDGNLMAIVGQQDDGGNTINVISGPTPPTPVGFTVDVDHGKFIVHWSGDFDGDALAPSDWSRAEVHASQDPFFVPSRATARGSIVSAAGGEVTIGVLKGPWTIKMLAWSQAGKMSAPSAPVDVEVPGYGDIVLEEIDAATTLIKNAGEMLLEGQQTLADKLAGIADLDPEEISDEIAQARQEAIDAALAEIANVEGTLTSAIGGKSSTTWSTSNPPVNYDGAVGDTWVKLTSLGSNGREIRRSRWQGDVWVDHPVDGAVLSNVDASTITTGFLDVVNRIRTGAILADKLLIGGGGELVEDALFDGGPDSPVWGPSTTGSAGPGSGIAPEGAKPGRKFGMVLKPKTAQTNMTLYNPLLTTGHRVPVEPGETYVASVWVYATEPITGMVDNTGNYAGMNLQIYTYPDNSSGSESPDGRRFAGSRTGTFPSGQWIKIGGQFTVGPATRFISPRPTAYFPNNAPLRTGDIYFGEISVRKAVDGTLITPGGIQTPHLAADVLEVGNLKAGAAALAEAVIKKLFAEVVVARMAQAEEFIGENALLTNSVTAPKIVASEELWAKLGQFVKIRAEHIESDALDFMVARGGTYLTSGGNGSWSDNGLFISGPDGTSLVRFPTDGTPLSLTASDVQIDRASIGELDTTQQTVRSSGTVTLASGVTAPASPPELTAAWQRDVVLNAPNPGLAYDWTGLARWGDKWVRGVNVLTAAGDDLDAIELYNPDGTLNKTIRIDLNPRAGVTVIGDIVYTIGPDHVARPGAERQWCHGFNLNTGARVSRWEFTRFTASGQKQFAVGTDGTNLLTAGVTPTPNLYVMKYNPATGAQIGGAPNPPSTGGDLIDFGWDLPARDLFGVRQSGNDLFVSHVGGTRIYTVSGTTITRKPDPNNSDGLAGFPHENRSCAGVAWVSGIPLVVDPQGRILEGSKFGSDATIQACVTWVNGSQETPPSPQATLNVPARATLSVSLPKRAGLQKNLYLKSSQYGGGWVKVTIPETTTSVVLDEVLAGLGQLPAQNTFPASTPAVLKSGNGGFEARGDGSGKWGPLTFGADGSMTGIRKTASGTLDITPTAANTPREVWVTFPVGRFTTPPTVVVSARSTVPGTRVTGVGSGGQTAAGFNAYLTRTDTTTTSFNWIAIEEG